MIRPDFSITQDDEFLFISIRLKYVKITNAEFDIDENNFKFYLKPYFLDLYLPHGILGDERAKSSYDVESGVLTCTVPKQTKGLFFPNLNLITTLLKARTNEFPTQPSAKAQPYIPQIEVISSTENKEEPEETKEKPQLKEILVPGAPKYGFNSAYSGVFAHLQEEMHDICDINIEATPKCTHPTNGS